MIRRDRSARTAPPTPTSTGPGAVVTASASSATPAAVDRVAAIVIVGLVLVALTLRGPIAAPGVIADLLGRDLDLGTTGLALLTTIPVLCFAFAAPPASALVRRTGAERALVIALGGVAVGSLVRVADGAVGALVGTALLGLAMTVGNIAAPVLVKARVPAARVDVVTGVYTAALNVGSVIAVVATGPLSELTGWRVALGGWALLALVAVIPWMRRGARPAGDGVEVIGGDAALVSVGDRHPAGDRTGPATSVRSRRRAGAVLLAAAFAGQGFAYYAFTAWLPLMLRDLLALPSTTAGIASGLFQVSAIAGAMLTAPLLRALGAARLIAIVGLAWAALPSSLLIAPSLWWAGSLLGGWAQGAAVTIVFVAIAQHTATPDATARLSGRVQFAGYAAGAAGPLLLGGIAESTSEWRIPLLVVAGAAAVVAVAGVAAMRLLDATRER